MRVLSICELYLWYVQLPTRENNSTADTVGSFLQVVAEYLSVEEVADIKEMFEKMDINHNGKITFEELKLGLHKLGHQIPDSDVRILMEAVST